jgi:hypothetical protein
MDELLTGAKRKSGGNRRDDAARALSAYGGALPQYDRVCAYGTASYAGRRGIFDVTIKRPGRSVFAERLFLRAKKKEG